MLRGYKWFSSYSVNNIFFQGDTLVATRRMSLSATEPSVGDGITRGASSSDSTSREKRHADDTTESHGDMSFIYRLVDIGANLTHRKYKHDIGEIIDRATRLGVEKIMVTGTSVKSSKDGMKLAQENPGNLYFTAGVHPHDAKSWDGTTEGVITELARQPQCAAIGECGLDFNRNFSPQDVQIQVFRNQVELACRLRMPLFIHEREAHVALMEVLDPLHSQLPPTVVHCFTGTEDELTAYLAKGYYIGLTGFVVKDKRGDGVRQMLTKGLLPLDRLLLETDAPFMFPFFKKKPVSDQHPCHGALTVEARNILRKYCSFERNEPCALPFITEIIAACMGVPPEEVAAKTTQNAKAVFGLR